MQLMTYPSGEGEHINNDFAPDRGEGGFQMSDIMFVCDPKVCYDAERFKKVHFITLGYSFLY